MVDTMIDKPVVATHPTITDASGSPLKFYRILPRTKCPVCGKGPYAQPLGVLFENDRSVTVHCIKCDYQTTGPAGQYKE